MGYFDPTEQVLNTAEGNETYNEFEDMSEQRKGPAWKHFWYNKAADASKCMHCHETIKNAGKTKILLAHLEAAHGIGGLRTNFEVMEFEDISAKKKNEVWQYFLRSTCGEAAKCKMCQKILRTGSKASTSGIKYHLSSVHKITFKKKRKSASDSLNESFEPANIVDVKFEDELVDS